jgi:hypothetical protein
MKSCFFVFRTWAFPFGSGYSLQSFCLGKKKSAAIPNAKLNTISISSFDLKRYFGDSV